MITPEQSAEIDTGAEVLLGLLKLGGSFYPPLGAAYPILNYVVTREVANLKTGLANGTIVPDGQGGFVPATNSHYDPVTGRFL